MKFESVDELRQFSFDDSEIRGLKLQDGQAELTLGGAMVRAGNSQNARYQDMYCGEMVLRFENARIARLMKEGMKYYDADGNLQKEIPDEDVPAPAQPAVLRRLAAGKIFTMVEDGVDNGYACEFGIDVPQEQDEEREDTFWLCFYFDHVIAMWDRYCSPAEG